jgi:Tfp pilus assembly protein PilF
MVKVKTTPSLLHLLVLISSGALTTVTGQALYPGKSLPSSTVAVEEDLSSYSAQDLTYQAEELMRDRQPISARTRLLAALEKDPNYYPTHLSLAEYYLSFVGHFKLSLKFLKQAEQLFLKANGKPPYFNRFLALEHSQFLLMLSQIRLNLDNYQGALQALDDFKGFGYFNANYDSSRAWILMKLNRLDDAIQSARSGVLTSAGRGGALNMLGILLSVSNQPNESLKVFDQAIQFEKTFGEDGSPATPLNNAGEVYRERFLDKKSESYWLQAKGLPDGCEHVLPSLNLAILMMEHSKLNRAEESMDSFESCVKQFTVKNDEEHRSLVSLARGRIALTRGDYKKAHEHLEQTLARGQWFGKIGTNVEDLQIGALQSFSENIAAKKNGLSFRVPETLLEYPKRLQESLKLSVLEWWTLRKARLLFQKMNNMEDIYIRHSDSIIDYPHLGTLLASFPTASLKKRLAQIQKSDDRTLASIYYDAYIAENLIAHGDYQEGNSLLKTCIQKIISANREDFDSRLLNHLYLVQASTLFSQSAEYLRSSESAFRISPASLKNYGIKLPVKSNAKGIENSGYLKKAGFLVHSNDDSLFSIDLQKNNDVYVIKFISNSPDIQSIEVKGSNLPALLNRLSEAVFTPDVNKL